MAVRKIVVTGGSGRVGRYVLRELRDRYDVVNADLTPSTEGEFMAADVMKLDAVRTALRGADDSSRPEPTLRWYRKLFGEVPELRDETRYAGDSRASMFSNAAARRSPGWQPSTDFNVLREFLREG